MAIFLRIACRRAHKGSCQRAQTWGCPKDKNREMAVPSKQKQTTYESQSKPGIKMVDPEPCLKEFRRQPSYLWLGLPLANLHLPWVLIVAPMGFPWASGTGGFPPTSSDLNLKRATSKTPDPPLPHRSLQHCSEFITGQRNATSHICSQGFGNNTPLLAGRKKKGKPAPRRKERSEPAHASAGPGG